MKILWGESGTTVDTTPGTWIVAVSAKEESPSALDRKQVVIDREGHYTCSGISSQRDTQTGIQVYQCRHYPKYCYA